LKLQLFVLSLINYLFVPLVDRKPIGVDRFDDFKRSLVDLRCEFELFVLPENTLGPEFLQLLLLKHLFIEKPLYHSFHLFGVELSQAATQ
jgi:hypothetical protein